ncbi:hypothetical protein BSLG_005544 [Batrachochytrium salamandrivorans]|nr:hypothetical protein BSLG_005544 [Batrachochytrium salamandrivorans]
MVGGVHPNGIPTAKSTFPTPLDMSVGAPSGGLLRQRTRSRRNGTRRSARSSRGQQPKYSTVDHAVGRGGVGGPHRQEKGKIPESVDLGGH